jgi:hypothetical protein
MKPTLIYIILGIIIAAVFGLAAYEYSERRKSDSTHKKELEDLVASHNEELEELKDLHIQSIEKMSKDYVETIEEQNEALGLYEKHIMNLDYTIQFTDKLIHDLDVKGNFEADDEVGGFFKALKDMQENLNNFKISKAEQDEEQDN